MARKRLITLLLVAAALIAAVAGGTYAFFTDPVGSTTEDFQAGTIDLEVDVDTIYYEEEFPIDFDSFFDVMNMAPGDGGEIEISLHNKGTLPAWIQVYVFPSHGDPADLWTCDSEDCSLQYSMEPVDPGWDFVLEPSIPKYLTFKISLPLCAGNNCQGAEADVQILIVAKQQAYLKGVYDCVALEDKDADWQPILNNAIEGEACYKVGSPLDLVFNAYGLTEDGDPPTEFQVTLNGPGGCANTDTYIGGGTYDPYTRGYWNNGTGLESTCGTPGEGIWNFGPGTYGTVTSNGDGTLSYMTELDFSGFCSGSDLVFEDVKFMIKETSGGWPAVLMETEQLNFTIDCP